MHYYDEDVSSPDVMGPESTLVIMYLECHGTKNFEKDTFGVWS